MPGSHTKVTGPAETSKREDGFGTGFLGIACHFFIPHIESLSMRQTLPGVSLQEHHSRYVTGSDHQEGQACPRDTPGTGFFSTKGYLL